jgi:poly [ADP-ribose] polymerase
MAIELKPRYLVFVSNTDNHNKYYKQIPNGDGTWTAEYGRVGSKPQKRVYSSNQYDLKYKEKLAKGYVDKTHLMTDLIEKVEPKTNNDYKKIEDEAIAEIVQRLQDLAKKAISDNYTVKAEAVTQAMVDNAQDLLLQLAEAKRVKTFNNLLIDLFAVIPRKMSKVEGFLATTTKDFPVIVQREQDLLDIMKGQIYKPESK